MSSILAMTTAVLAASFSNRALSVDVKDTSCKRQMTNKIYKSAYSAMQVRTSVEQRKHESSRRRTREGYIWSRMDRVDFNLNEKRDRRMTYSSYFDTTDRRGKVLTRPEWQKILRCEGDSAETCHACATDNWKWNVNKVQREELLDCWTNCKDAGNNVPRCLKTKKSSKFKRHITHIHLKCDVDPANPWVEMQLALLTLANGKLSFFWDGIEVTQGNGFEIGGGLHLPVLSDNFTQAQAASTETMQANIIALKLNTSNEGGHVFEMEFTPKSNNQVGVVKVKSMMFWLKEDYTQCVDTKACLETLMDYGASGLLLRSSNRLQLACLSPSSGNGTPVGNESSACQAWQQCLNLAGPEVSAGIVNLLLAAGVQDVEGAPSMASDEPTSRCLHPPSEDAESWDCDCYEKMKQICDDIKNVMGASSDYTDKKCIRAQLCMHPRVCQKWKQGACVDLDTLMNEISTSMLLLARSAHTESPERQLLLGERASASSLDDLYAGKSCA